VSADPDPDPDRGGTACRPRPVRGRLREDRRGVSVSVTHVLTIAITTVLIAGLLIGVGGYLDDFRESTTREELSAIGERLAGEFVRAETLATLQYAEVELRTNHPQQVSGRSYTVRLTDSAAACGATSPPCFVLASTAPDLTVIVGVESSVPVADSAVAGGDVVIAYDGTDLSIRGVDS
jgi:hypothetical protein